MRGDGTGNEQAGENGFIFYLQYPNPKLRNNYSIMASIEFWGRSGSKHAYRAVTITPPEQSYFKSKKIAIK